MPTQTEITINSYNQTAEQYTKNVAALGKTIYLEKFISLLEKNASILDLACGSGRDAKIFYERGLRVNGIDLSQNMIDIARQTVPGATFALQDIRQANFPPNYFDGIWCCAGLLHIPRTQIPDLLINLKTCLKERGIFYAGVKEGAGEGIIKDNRYEGDIQKFYSYFARGELEQMFESTGFEIIESSSMNRQESYLKHSEIDILARKK